MTIRRTTGVSPSAMSVAAMNTSRIGRMASPAVGMKFIWTWWRPAAAPGRPRSRGRQRRDRELADDLAHLAAQRGLRGGVVAPPDRLDDDPAHRAHLVGPKAPRRRRRRADADA